MTLLQKSLETKRSFVRYVSHEIRTPLNTVSLGLEVLHKKLEQQSKYFRNNVTLFSPRQSQDQLEPDQTLEMSLEIYDSCHIALDILNDLLFYDKIEEGKLILYKQKINSCDLIAETVRTFTLQVIPLLRLRSIEVLF